MMPNKRPLIPGVPAVAMHTIRTRILLCILGVHTLLRIAHPCEGKNPEAGFFLPANNAEVTISYMTYNDLIVLPVTINNGIKVNLILDTGCRNVLLFGKRFEKLFGTLPNREVRFSGYGERPPLTGKLSLENEVSIHTIVGKRIPIVILRDKNLFSGNSNIDGIIGYDIFIRFEVEVNSLRKEITFRSAYLTENLVGYTRIPLKVEDTRPLVQSRIFFSERDEINFDLMLDTGSALGLFIRSSDNVLLAQAPKQMLGKGLGGNVKGTLRGAKKIVLEKLEINIRDASIYGSMYYTSGSVGMQIIKDYAFVLNYCKGYAWFKKMHSQKKLT